MSKIQQAAQKEIGTEAPKDWLFAPSSHAETLGEQAGALKRVITRSNLEELSDTFETADRAANRARDRYKFLARWSAFLGFVATVIAGGLLLAYARGLSLPVDLSVVATIQGVLLALSLALSLIVAHTRPFRTWMRERATAEHQRIVYFNKVIEASEPEQGGELPLLPLQLEYFRRYQLDVQTKYYHERGAQHAYAMRRSTVLRWLGTLLILAAGLPVVAALFGGDWTVWLDARGVPGWGRDADFQQRLFIALSTAGAALQGLLAAMSLMNQDERNATRYAATHKNLAALSMRPLDEARAAAMQGDTGDVRTFVALVQEQISSEHREWVDLQSIAPEMSLQRLKELSLPRIW